MKNMITRALRTFFQAAAGYIAANLVVSLSGVYDDRESMRTVLLTLITAAVACGLSAVMNMPKKAQTDGDEAHLTEAGASSEQITDTQEEEKNVE